MNHGSVVPQRNTPHLPLESYIMVIRRMDVIVQEVQNLIAFIFLQLGEARDKAGVDVQCPEASDWMSPNSGVVGVDWGTVGRHLPKVEDSVVLKTRGVNGVKTGQKVSVYALSGHKRHMGAVTTMSILHGIRQSIVQTIRRYPRRVTTNRRVLFHSEHRVRWRVDLERGVGMEIAAWPRGVGQYLPVIYGAASDDMMARVFLRRVTVELSIVFKEFDLTFSGQILRAEEDHTAFVDQQSKLIELLWCQGGELDILQDGSNRFGQGNHFDTGDREQRFLVGVGKETSVGRWGSLFVWWLWRDMIFDLGVEVWVEGDWKSRVRGNIGACSKVGHVCGRNFPV